MGGITHLSHDKGYWLELKFCSLLSSDEVSCDPFSSASDAKSVFLDSLQDDSALETPKRDSFLSFIPSSNRSSIMFRRERTSSN
jgi:hypothetical protein